MEDECAGLEVARGLWEGQEEEEQCYVAGDDEGLFMDMEERGEEVEENEEEEDEMLRWIDATGYGLRLRGRETRYVLCGVHVRLVWSGLDAISVPSRPWVQHTCRREQS